MNSSKEFVTYVCSRLAPIGTIEYKSMMGGYLIYVNGKYCLAINNDQVYLKPTNQVKALLREIIEEPMYPGAKESFVISQVDDSEYLCQIVLATYHALPNKTKKK